MNDTKRDKYERARVFNSHAREYDAWFDGSLVYEIELAALATLFTEMSGPVLEVGVGPGRFAEKLGVEYGFDPARSPLKFASGRGIKCCQAFGEELPVKDGIIGTIYLLFTLCFAADPQRILLECSRILKDDGKLVIGMIPSGSAWGENLAAKKRAGHPIYSYANFYTIGNIKSWLAKAEMNIVEYRSTLYQVPESVEYCESPQIVLDGKAGFAVIVAEKKHGQDYNTDH